MATNSARNKASLALERLEARDVPAAYNWDAGLIDQAFPDAPPPPPATAAAADVSVMTEFRLASHGGGDATTVEPPSSPARMPLFASNLSDDGEGGTIAIPDRDVLRANDGQGATVNDHPSEAGKTTETGGQPPVTAGSDTPSPGVNWTPPPDYTQLRFASNPSGIGVQEWAPASPPVEPPANNTAVSPPSRLLASDSEANPSAKQADSTAKADPLIGAAPTLADEVAAIAGTEIHEWLFASS
jgi:hypothetical protein